MSAPGTTDEDGEQLPKSRRVRSVPLTDQAAPARDQLSRREHFTDPDDLVFCSELGTRVCGMQLLRRYRYAARDAKLRPLRFHEYADVRVMPISIRSCCSE